MSDLVKSVNDNQHQILADIMRLYGIERFDCDLTYGNGQFYKHIPEPLWKFDIDGELDGVIEASSTNVEVIDDDVLQSVIFDPPFLTYVRAARKGNGNMIMSGRFSGYWTYDELARHYIATITEAARIIKAKGYFVVKCQDIIHNHKMYCTHANVIRWAEPYFDLEDLFILTAKHRLPSPNRAGTQKHARVYHSYFLVFKRRKK